MKESELDHLPAGSIVGIIGAGTMGVGIAQVLLVAGYKVLIYDQQFDLSKVAVSSVKKRLSRLVEKGKMTQQDCEEKFSLIHSIESIGDLAEASMVVEAIVENLPVKQKLFQDLEKITSEKTIFATNTSSISITAIGSALKHPDRLAGWHFFNPAPLMSLVEVVRGLATSEHVINRLYCTAKYCGKTPVHAKSTPGFIVNRVARPFYAEAMRVLNETDESIVVLDSIMRDLGGFKMGPFELMDLIGNDVNYAVTESVWSAFYYDERFIPSLIQKEYVEAGYYGRKSGRGFYQYDNENRIIQSADIHQRTLSKMESNLTFEIKLNSQSLFYSAWKLLLNRYDIKFSEEQFTDKDILMSVNNVMCYITTGKTATEQAHCTHNRAVVMIDLAIDYHKTELMALARNKGCSDDDFGVVVNLFTSLDKKVIEVADTPGLLVMRTIAMLVNEASDVVGQKVSNVVDTDIAMKLGVGYPKGPLEWADEIGINIIYQVLNNLHRIYGSTRYRISPKLQEKYYLGEKFYD